MLSRLGLAGLRRGFSSSSAAALHSPLSLVCSGCGTVVDGSKEATFKCSNAARRLDVDHVLVPAPLADGLGTGVSAEDLSSTNPFVRYRGLLYSHRVALARGMSDAQYVEMANNLNEALHTTGGISFSETPMVYHEPLHAFLKVEVSNVGQSHKARHLANVMLYLLALKHTQAAASDAATATALGSRRLAVASCGNAGLAAAEVAAAAEWPIDVCIPPDADDAVKARLAQLAPRGVATLICDRSGADVPTAYGPVRSDGAADPTLAVMNELVASHGSIPFSVQGSACGLAVEGSQTLAWEVLTQLKRDYPQVARLGNMYVQVGGGALGAGIAQGMRRAIHGETGRDDATPLMAPSLQDEPTLVCVQPDGCQPLDRAWSRVVADAVTPREAAQVRDSYMWPWHAPHSVAHGILDDETYDWVALCEGMARTGGGTLSVSDEAIRQAHTYAHGTLGVRACHTGAAGLAALMRSRHAQPPTDGTPPDLVVLSGLDRSYHVEQAFTKGFPKLDRLGMLMYGNVGEAPTASASP